MMMYAGTTRCLCVVCDRSGMWSRNGRVREARTRSIHVQSNTRHMSFGTGHMK